MAQLKHIAHSIPPTYDERSRVLVLGSLPSPKSRETGFNYGHPQNRFWRVMAALANEPVPSTNERKRDFCLRHHIALWDVVGECDIEGASDTSIRNAKPNPLTQITRYAPIEAVFCTGTKSHELYRKLCEADTGIPAVKLPSTSPANAACGMDELLEAYAQVFHHTAEFEPPALDVPQVVELEQTIAAAGTPLSELMDRAGTALARRIERTLQELDAGTYPRDICYAPGADSHYVVLLCGNGNNGGDGWVAAELLANAGRRVCIVTGKAAEDITAQPAHDAAMKASRTLESLGGTVARNPSGGSETHGPSDDAHEHDGEQARHASSTIEEGAGLPASPLMLVNPSETELNAVMCRATVIVDAILGTGATGRDPKEPFATWIETANAARGHAAIIAADVPSGICAQDGQLATPHIVADETVTMIVPKPGLSAPECGTVHIAPLAYIEPHLP